MAITTSEPLKSAETSTKVWRVVATKAEIDPVGFVARLRRRKLILGIVTPVVLLVVWELASQLGWIDARFFPGPSRILVAAVDMITSGQWFIDVGVTLRTICTASLIGFVVGALAGVLMGTARTVRYLIEPTLSAFYTIPKIALLPLMLLIFGVGDMPGYLLVGLAIFFIAWISTLEAVLDIPTGYREAAEAFGVTGPRAFVHVTLPAILPAIFVSLRISVGQAVLIVIMVEYLMGAEGIGYRIWHSWSLFDANTMYVGIVSVALLGFVLQLLVKFAGSRLVPWSGGVAAAEK